MLSSTVPISPGSGKGRCRAAVTPSGRVAERPATGAATSLSAARRPRGSTPQGAATPAGAALARLAAACPTRPVDWRWQQAGLLIDLGLRCRGDDDQASRAARRFRAALGRCRGDVARRRLEASTPGIAGACAIHAGPPNRRWAVEARLLAGESVEVIARKQELAAEAVACFATLFFDVAGRLGCRGYITHLAIGMPRLRDGGAEDTGAFWRLLGFHGGPALLDLALAAAAIPAGQATAEVEAIRPALALIRRALMPTPTVPARRRRPAKGTRPSSRKPATAVGGNPPAADLLAPDAKVELPGDAGTETRSEPGREAAGPRVADTGPSSPFPAAEYGPQVGESSQSDDRGVVLVAQGLASHPVGGGDAVRAGGDVAAADIMCGYDSVAELAARKLRLVLLG